MRETAIIEPTNQPATKKEEEDETIHRVSERGKCASDRSVENLLFI